MTGRTPSSRSIKADYEALRKAHAQPKQQVVSLAVARARRTPIEWHVEDLAYARAIWH